MVEPSKGEAERPIGRAPEGPKPRGLWRRLRDALAAPDLTVAPDLPESWAHRITDERNLWLAAVQEQLQGDFGEAAVRFLEDAQVELALGRKARSALSLASAAFVLREAGEDKLAIACYRGAAQQFREHADRAVDGSPREALWSLERAGAFYRLGRLPEEVEKVRSKHAVLNAALHPDQADKIADVFVKTEIEPKKPSAAGGRLPTEGVQISREYTARLEHLLERF